MTKPEYQRYWSIALDTYITSSIIIGYRAETLDGVVLAYGKTRIEALTSGLQELERLQTPQNAPERVVKLHVACGC